jgi:hypothetical protein
LAGIITYLYLDIKSIKYFIRAHIVNPDTLDQIFEAFQQAGRQQAPKWDERMTFSELEHPEQFFAILGSKNGAGVAYFLISQGKVS